MWNVLIPGLVGLLAGGLSGFLGIGGGIIFVPVFIGLLGMDPKMAVGTSLAAMAPAVILNAVAHVRYGHIDPRLAMVIIPAAVIGGQLGSWLTTVAPAPVLKKVLGVLLVLIGIQLVLGFGPGKAN